MEGKNLKRVASPSSSSSSSFTFEPFGVKDSSSSSSTSGIFGSIFAPPSHSKVLGSGSLRSEMAWNNKLGLSDEAYRSNERENIASEHYQDQRIQPCHLSCSIYYGGQDIFHHPRNNPNSSDFMLKKDGTEDESGSASRGNWWQGSLYY